MKAILHNFRIPITERQAGAIRAQWSKHGKDRANMIIIQPVTTAGPFTLRHAFLDCAIVSPEATLEIAKILAVVAHDRPPDGMNEGDGTNISRPSPELAGKEVARG